MSVQYKVVQCAGDTCVTIGEIYTTVDSDGDDDSEGYALLDDVACNTVEELREFLQRLLDATYQEVLKEEDLYQ